jgi:hypothetical protein
VIVPHLYGLFAPIYDIKSWASTEGLCLTDDAAQAFGISVGGRCLGSYGHSGIFSFGPYKSLSTPRGGALISGDGRVVKRARAHVSYREGILDLSAFKYILIDRESHQSYAGLILSRKIPMSFGQHCLINDNYRRSWKRFVERTEAPI